MELILKSAVIATLITILVMAAHWLSAYAAGLVSGLPFTLTASLIWIGLGQGTSAAVEAAVGGIVGCALVSAFALAYNAAAQRASPASALLFSILCLAAGLLLAQRVAPSMLQALLATCAAAVVALLVVRSPAQRQAQRRHRTLARVLATALVVGVGGASVMLVVVRWDPSLEGVVTALPFIGLAGAFTCHTLWGKAPLPQVLRGCVISSLARAAFCAVFVLCAPEHGLALALLGAGLATGCVYLSAIGVARLRRIEWLMRLPRSLSWPKQILRSVSA